MRVGVALMFENWDDWERSETRPDDPQDIPDWSFVQDELAVGDMAEELGFDSIWTAEHHFCSYIVEPNPLQLLTYFAARTKRVDLGTCVIVVPWHDPVRIAEQAAMLDCMLGEGRTLTLGLGRGAALSEYEGFRVPMTESRKRFNEGVQVLQLALTQERFSFDGEIHRIHDLAVRPRPRDPSLASRMLCSWMSTQSLAGAAELGLGMYFTTSKNPLEYDVEIAQFNEVRRTKGWDPVKPTIFLRVVCDRDEDEAWRLAREHIGKETLMGFTHYGLLGGQKFAETGGYEWWANTAAALEGAEQEAVLDASAQDAIWGTPEMCLEKIRKIQAALDPEELTLVFRIGGMSVDATRRSMELFAEEVLPALREPVPAGV
jgi:alkanesulfonate monooxygenase SsuD/methylene tetrahydromethanopterin reductase-like flavin-dependent oxidoreductase (luciferase family)